MTEKRRWNRGDVRPEDGYIFNRYVKVKRKDGTITLCPQFLRPSVFKRTKANLKLAIRNWQKKNAKQLLEKAKERKRANPEHYRKKYREAHARRREKAIAYLRKRYAEDPAKYRRIAKEWRQRNPGYQKERLSTNPEAKIASALRRRILKALSGEVKSGSTYELLGCTWQHLRWHIESQFDSKMNWENHGSYWHLDHIRPLIAFDLCDPAQQRPAFHWKNLQPLKAKENLRKNSRIGTAPALRRKRRNKQAVP